MFINRVTNNTELKRITVSLINDLFISFYYHHHYHYHYYYYYYYYCFFYLRHFFVRHVRNGSQILCSPN